MIDPRAFVRDLAAENVAFWPGRDPRLDEAAFEALIRLARDVDPESAALYERTILPDEYRHAAIGHRALHLRADTPRAQAIARAACREMNDRIFAAYVAHRARVDRGA